MPSRGNSAGGERFEDSRVARARRRPGDRTELDARSGARSGRCAFLEELRRALGGCAAVAPDGRCLSRLQAAAAGIEQLSRTARHVSEWRDQMKIGAFLHGQRQSGRDPVSVHQPMMLSPGSPASIQAAELTLGGADQASCVSACRAKSLLDAEVSQFQITQNQKFAMLEAETRRNTKPNWHC